MDGGKVEHGKENSNCGAERGDSGILGGGKGCRTGPAPEIDEGEGEGEGVVRGGIRTERGRLGR